MKKIGQFFKKYWITILIYIGLFVLYMVISDFKLINSFLFPTVDKIVDVYQTDGHTMLLNMLSSFRLLIPSILISLAIALILGTLMGLNKHLRDVLYPVVYTFSVVPSILLSPFALVLAPSFWQASLFLVVYGTIWGTLFATITGIMTIDKRYLDNAATLELHGPKLFFKVILPAASPSILAGFVNSLRGSFVMLVYAEMYGAQYGLGYYVRKYAEFGLYPNVWAGFLFLVVILVIVMQLFERLKVHLLKWTMN